MRQKTRFVCVSDTHGYTPSEAGFKLPAGDVLIHAGDLTNNGSIKELRRTMDWICKADFEIKIIVGGNHDVTLDPAFYEEHGQSFHGQHLEDSHHCLKLVMESPSVVLLRHEPALIRLTRAGGPNTVFKIFGSPYSQSQGNWAFGYESSDAATLWGQIPIDTDIVVTHTPPRSHCDQKPNGMFVGCVALRSALSLIRPHLAVCGHVHEGRGYERVRWRGKLSNTETETETQPGSDSVDHVTRGILPPVGSKKQSLVDLTGKRDERLDNGGFSHPGQRQHDLAKTQPISSASPGSESSAGVPKKASPQHSSSAHPSLGAGSPGSSSRGFDSALETLRKETCIVNAAVVSTSWPHQGGKRFNSPIVVDLELPVWQDDHAVANG
ncbi:Metallophosphoesterase [Penicillium camemberti]|uniref:Metallophosphoesterase n=1 Tax=Penicillium camemberti (strain FM 013) TaxID=1429867 RepID=A0A0G4PLM6_PENC3|nr:Metallophosphoesterase [Penicillium camemberti]